MNNGGEFQQKPNNITIGNTIDSPENTIIDLNNLNKDKKKSVWEDSVAKVTLPNINDMLSSVQDTKSIDTKSIEVALIKILKNQEYMINAIHDLQDRI